MWNIFSKIGSPDPKMNTMQMAGYHTLFGSCLNPVPNKQFSYFKSATNLSMNNRQNYSSSVATTVAMMDEMEENSKMQEPKLKNVPNYVCNSSKKKRKKRRRRKKKSKNQQILSNNMEKPKQRERTISMQSEDSFIIFFEKEEESESEDFIFEDFGSSDSVIPNKKVRFASDNELCEVHSMVVWSYAYQAARKGPWEEYARDRCRFKSRVARTESLISHVFSADHRSRIYDQRFCHLEI